MQDAVLPDMFNVGGSYNPRSNGHIRDSSGIKGFKKDRKGCPKGKIEMIMKNNSVLANPGNNKKTKKTLSNHVIDVSSVVKSELIDPDDPYAFTEPEPQVLSLYPTGNTSFARKLSQSVSKQSTVPNMVCQENESRCVGRQLVQPVNNKIQTSPKLPDVLKHQNKCSKPSATTSPEGMSKTMVKLQANIARSKVIGKRRKVVQQLSSLSEWEEGKVKVKSEHEHSVEEINLPVFARVCIPAKRMLRQSTWQRERKTRHEALQRILHAQKEAALLKDDLYPLGLEVSDSEYDETEAEESSAVFQRHWFSGWSGGGGGAGRDYRMAQVRGELRRRLHQAWQGVERREQPNPNFVQSIVTAARIHPTATAFILHPRLSLTVPLMNKHNKRHGGQTGSPRCSLSESCSRIALPLTRHCALHIMHNPDQLLYRHCAARMPDNSQCMFPVPAPLPLCSLHQENISRVYLEPKPKKKSKKAKPSAFTRSPKRGKKKKKCQLETQPSVGSERNEEELEFTVEESSAASPLEHLTQAPSSSTPCVDQSDIVFLPDTVEIQVQLQDTVEEVSEEVLAMASFDPAELVSQASRMLEEHDLTNMLNQINPDAFNDLFIEDKNGEYEPTREETEELERALEAVDKDVRSLERLTCSHAGILPLESLALLEEAPHPAPHHYNGFAKPQRHS